MGILFSWVVFPESVTHLQTCFPYILNVAIVTFHEVHNILCSAVQFTIPVVDDIILPSSNTAFEDTILIEDSTASISLAVTYSRDMYSPVPCLATSDVVHITFPTCSGCLTTSLVIDGQMDWTINRAAWSQLKSDILPAEVVCSTSLMASLIRSVGGLSKYFYLGLWLDYLNADVIGQSINRCGVAYD